MDEVDVMLDTVHFSGGNTSFQALQLGLPVVTRPMLYTRSRGTASLYRIMGFEDLVADSEDDYVALALRVVQDHGYRDQCRREIVARCGVLFDSTDVGREYEALFAAMAGGDGLASWTTPVPLR